MVIGLSVVALFKKMTETSVPSINICRGTLLENYEQKMEEKEIQRPKLESILSNLNQTFEDMPEDKVYPYFQLLGKLGNVYDKVLRKDFPKEFDKLFQNGLKKGLINRENPLCEENVLIPDGLFYSSENLLGLLFLRKGYDSENYSCSFAFSDGENLKLGFRKCENGKLTEKMDRRLTIPAIYSPESLIDDFIKFPKTFENTDIMVMGAYAKQFGRILLGKTE